VAATAKTNRIVNQVSAETKVPARRIRSGLTIKQVNTSAFVEMGYTSTKRTDAVPVVRAVAADTVRFLFQSQFDLARARVDAAQKQVDQTENALNALSRKTGAESPEVAYNAISNGLPALQATVARAKNAAAAAQIQQQVKDREAQLAALGQDQGQYLALIDIRRRAVNLRRDAEQTEREASAQLAAAGPGSALAIGKAHHSFPFSDVLQTAGGAAAGGVFLAVVYLFVSEVWAGVKRRSPRPAAVATG
jgi:VIT1/CCC1 family predicted Fe2+/Mn2+ transporter